VLDCSIVTGSSQRLALAAACAILAMTAGIRGSVRSQPQTPTVSLIENYTDWVNGRRDGAELIAVDLDAARRELGRLDPSSLPVDPSLSPEQAREQRRRLIASFALELAAVGSKTHAMAAARLVEWACPLIRSHAPLNEFDREWQLAALAVLEGGIDSATLHAHLAHVQDLFPDEPRLLLARGVAEEQFAAPAEVLTRGVAAADFARAREALVRADGERFRASERAIARFREALGDESIRAEAALRFGHVQLRLGRDKEALAAWTNVERQTTDRAIIYLVYLFRGQALEHLGRREQARQAYADALRSSPGAHSAALRLAALAFRYGRSDEASGYVDTLLRDDDPRRDPWWSYYAADWRFWYPRIDRVRTLLRTRGTR
jgi:tetratricopeptide (TPR) repeat protein